jgi:ABC-type bacteriocin/lantibiotic exporter with double-glycine peptidase domain
MYEEATQVANDAVSGIRTVASFCAEHKVMKAYYKKCEAPVRQGIRQGIVSGLGFGVSFFVLYCTYALCFYVGAKFVLDGEATFTEVFRVSKFFRRLNLTLACVCKLLCSSSGVLCFAHGNDRRFTDKCTRFRFCQGQGISILNICPH